MCLRWASLGCDEAPRRGAYHANRAAAYLARGNSPGGGYGQFDACGHLENHAWTEGDGGEGDGVSAAAALNAKAALLDCDAALEMSPGHVKAKFRKAQALWRLARVGEARTCAMSALHGAPDEATEAEVRALLESFDEPWRPTPFPARGGDVGERTTKERNDAEGSSTGGGSRAEREKKRTEGDDDDDAGAPASGGVMGGMGDLLASLGASSDDGYPDFDELANFKSAGADEVFAEVDRFAAEMRAKGSSRETPSIAASGIDSTAGGDVDSTTRAPKPDVEGAATEHARRVGVVLARHR